MTKSNVANPCPRCLVKKSDTPKMGTHLDMRNRHTNIRIDDHPRQNTIERARQLVFEQGIPLNSKRLKDMLGKFSGVPICVHYYKLRIPCPKLIHGSIEHLLYKTQPPRFRIPQIVRCRPTTRIRTWCLEGDFHPLNVDSVCHRRRYRARPEQTLLRGAPLWEWGNTPVHRKSLGNAQTGRKGF